VSGAIRGVILDVDGTLIDSNDAHARAWIDALTERGGRVSFDDVRRLIGMGGDKLLPRITGLQSDRPPGKQIVERRGHIFRERYLPHLQPLPGARPLLERLRRDGLQLAVASSAQEDELRPLLERAGVADLLEQRTSSDDAERSKPDPDIVQAALHRLRLAPGHVVMIGDTPYDVEAAQRAGIAIVALRSGGWDDAALAGAAAVYRDPADLLQHYDESVFGRPAASPVFAKREEHP
jgi:HAD superfamily hydrolase (TIGR01509 family)